MINSLENDTNPCKTGAPVAKRSPAGFAVWANVITILFIAFFFRVFAIDHIPGLNGDETIYGLFYFDVMAGADLRFTTSTGNYLNPFSLVPIFILQHFLEPSLLILRTPSLISGILLPFLAFFFMEKVFDRKTTLIIALLAAVLPVNIAYSRVGWDISQTPLVAMFVLYAAFKRKWLLLSISFVVSLIIHPTNIFLLPTLIIFLLAPGLCRQGWTWAKTRMILGATLIGSVIMGMIFFQHPVAMSKIRSIPVLFVERLIDPTGWGIFLADSIRFLTGSSAFQSFCGTGYSGSLLLIDTASGILLLTLMAIGLIQYFKRRAWDEIFFVAGVLVSMILFYLMAGNNSIRPPFERYGMFLIMPLLVMTGMLMKEVRFFSRNSFSGLFTIIIICWVFLGSFYNHYFKQTYETGGSPQVAFRTGRAEPKSTALNLIIQDASGADKMIMTSSFWSHAPLRYLAGRSNDVFFLDEKKENETAVSPRVTGREIYYAVVFNGDTLDRFINNSLRSVVAKSWRIDDFGGRAFLNIYRFRSSPIENGSNGG